MDFLTLTQSNWFIIGPVAKLLGYVMNGIYNFLDMLHIPNIGLSIILFTIIVKALMLPLTIRQQKFSKLNSVMSPELQAITKKYKDKKDNESMVKMQSETREVYDKYGTSPMGGCLQMLIQMPILFALYQVIYKIPGYVTKIRVIYENVQQALIGITGFETNEGLISLATSNGVSANDLAEKGNRIIDLFYNFDKNEWNQFMELFPSLQQNVEKILPQIDQINYFLGVDLAMAPSQQLWPGVLIPILAGLSQWLSTKIMGTGNSASTDMEGSMGSTMKTMNIVMPLMSVFFCFTFSAGIGVYWIASSVVQILIQLIVNKHLESVDINEMVAKNQEKINVKRAKQGLPPQKAKPVINVHTLEEQKEREEKFEAEAKKRSEEHSKTSSEYYTKTATKKGKLASKASMVSQYNEKQQNKNKK